MKLHQSILNRRRRNCALTNAGRTRVILLIAVLVSFSSTHAQTNYQRLLSFGLSEFSSSGPNSPLIEGSDGLLYGTALGGGNRQDGAVFRLRKDGSGFTVLHSFSPTDGDGYFPRATVLEASDGLLYGTTQGGSDPGSGTVSPTVFKLNKDGNGYKVLHHFTGYGGDEFLSQASLAEGSDGALYGTTAYASTNNAGTVFKLNKDGNGYSVLHSFRYGSGVDGANPSAGVLAGRAGGLYGMTAYGGAHGNGTVFKLNIDGTGYEVLHSFDRGIGEGSAATRLVEGRDGALYGTTKGSPANVFKLNEDGSGYTVLHRFAPTDSLAPQNLRPTFGAQLDIASLMQGSDGALYGKFSKDWGSGLGTVFKLNTDGSGYSVLSILIGAANEFLWPQDFVEGSDGALYGTTIGGGKYESGSIFKLNKDGTGYSVVRDFATDPGAFPGAVLTATDGRLYGTTIGGGTNVLGTVFKLNQDGSGYEILRHFGGRDGEGYYPLGLTEGSDGALYGMTQLGGTNDAGTVFKLRKDGGGYTVLRRWTGDVGEQVFPGRRLVEGNGGALYGTTAISRNYETNAGSSVFFGTIFKLNKDGSDYSVLRRFDGAARSGSGPPGGLLKGSDETLYGITSSANGRGTVFKLNQDGSGYLVLHAFSGEDGRYPFAVVEGRDGMLYGTTIQGGTYDWGTLFKMSKDGSNFSLLHSFPYIGGYPSGGIVEGRDGVLYGTTYNDGNHEFGTVFSLNEDGTGFTILYRFTGKQGDNAGSSADLTIGVDGTLFGTTSQDGDLGQGTVFKLFYSPPHIVISRIELGGTGAGLLSLSGSLAAQTYRIQATTNLRPVTWQVIGSQPAEASGVLQFLDPDANNYPARFYRVIAP